MIERYGKEIDVLTLKKDLDKLASIENAGNTSLAITPGPVIDTCPVCKSPEREYLQTIYRFDYHECAVCGAAYTSNPPGESGLKKIYNSDSYNQAVKRLVANESLTDYRIEHIAKPKVEYILRNISTHKDTWLDIGCGVGEILSVLSAKGIECVGLETSRMIREYGMKRLGVKILDEYIDETTVQRHLHNWGVISLFNILEHIKDPASLISAIAQTQEVNDNLVIEVPHFPSISALCQMAFPRHVDRNMHPPHHLFLFSVKSLEILLHRHGYELTHAWYFGQDFYEFFSTLSIFAKELKNSKLGEAMAGMLNGFQENIDKNRMCDAVLVIARKGKVECR